MPYVIPTPHFDLKESVSPVLLSQLTGALLYFCVPRTCGGQYELEKRWLESPRGDDLIVQFFGRQHVPQEAVLLLTLDAYPFALILAKDIHASLRLATSPIFLGVVLPDVTPQIETKRLECGWIIWGIPSFNVCAHELAPRSTILARAYW